MCVCVSVCVCVCVCMCVFPEKGSIGINTILTGAASFSLPWFTRDRDPGRMCVWKGYAITPPHCDGTDLQCAAGGLCACVCARARVCLLGCLNGSEKVGAASVEGAVLCKADGVSTVLSFPRSTPLHARYIVKPEHREANSWLNTLT